MQPSPILFTFRALCPNVDVVFIVYDVEFLLIKVRSNVVEGLKLVYDSFQKQTTTITKSIPFPMLITGIIYLPIIAAREVEKILLLLQYSYQLLQNIFPLIVIIPFLQFNFHRFKICILRFQLIVQNLTTSRSWPPSGKVFA